MNKNDVVTLVATTGAEYVGKFSSEDDQGVWLSSPHIVTPQGESLGFMPTVAMTGEVELDKVCFRHAGIVTVVPTADQVQKEYIRSSSGIIT